MSETLIAALAEFDCAGSDCPARLKHLGDQKCPKCSAAKDEGCREEIRAAYRFIAKVREYASAPTLSRGQG